MTAATGPGAVRSGSTRSRGARSGATGARWGLLLVLVVWTLLPFLLLLLVSTAGGGWRFPSLTGTGTGMESWATWLTGGGRLTTALLVTVGLAAGTGALAAFLGLLLGRGLSRARGWQRVLGAGSAFLAVAAPPLALGVGLQFSFLALGLGGTLAGVLLAHMIPAAGYTTLFFLGVFSSWEGDIEVEARQLGATPLQTLLRVTLPLLRRPLAEAFVLGFLVSWAQVPLTLLVGQGRVRTLTVEVLSLIQAGQDPLATAGALLLAAPPLALMTLVAIAVRRAEVVLP